MSYRRQSFFSILSLPLLLSKSPHHARGSVSRQKSFSIIGGADDPGPANPSPCARTLAARSREAKTPTGIRAPYSLAHRGRRIAGIDLGGRSASQLVATTAENRLSRRRLHHVACKHPAGGLTGNLRH